MTAPRPSASVVLLSPTNSVLLLHRGSSAPSFASAHVFPGGNIDPFHDGHFDDDDGARQSPAVTVTTTTTTTSGSATTTATNAPPPLHLDTIPFRLAAIRECFEESGILLAKRKDGRRDEKGHIVEMLRLDGDEAREQARRAVHEKKVRFEDWVDSIGGFVDTENLIPFTRWITPITASKRFTTQMYLYLLPLGESTTTSPPNATLGPSSSLSSSSSYDIPAPDGREVTHATFAPASTWLRRADAGKITLYPPQHYLLHLVARFTAPSQTSQASQTSRPLTLAPAPSASAPATAPRTPSPLNPSSHSPPPPSSPSELADQRTALLTHIFYPTPPPPSPYPASSPLSPAMLNPLGTALARIPPGRRIICPRTLFVRSADGGVVLALDKPGPELQGMRYPDLEDDSGARVECGGDGDRVAVVAFEKGEIKRVEVRMREDVLREEREGRATALQL